MKFSSRSAQRIGYALASGILLLTVLRALAFAFGYDADAEYFRSDAISTLLYIAALLLCCIGTALVFGRSPAPQKDNKDKTPEQKRADREQEKLRAAQIKALKRAGVKPPADPMPYLEPSPVRRTRLLRIADVVCVAVFLLAAVLDLLAAGNSEPVLFPTLRRFELTYGDLYLFRAILALIAAVAFAIPICGHRLSYLAPPCHLATALWCLLSQIIQYIDWNTPMNGPVKTYSQLALCFAALYITAHARLALTDLILRRRNLFAVIIAVLGISGGLSELCLLPTGIFEPQVLILSAVTTVLGLHAAAAMIPMFQGEIPHYVLPAPSALPSPTNAEQKERQ